MIAAKLISFRRLAEFVPAISESTRDGASLELGRNSFHPVEVIRSCIIVQYSFVKRSNL